MSSLPERCWWRSLPVPVPPQSGKDSFSLNGAALAELVTAVHEKGAPFRFKARGYSMYPAICDGDVIVIAPAGKHTLVAGAVAAYHHPRTGKFVVHRLVDYRNGRFLGRGDNTGTPDGWIPPEKILGIVTEIEREGRLFTFPDVERHPRRTRLLYAHYIHIVPVLNAVRRGIIRGSQSPTLKAVIRPLIGPAIRRGLLLRHGMTDHPAAGMDCQDEILSMNFRFLKWPAVRMEFSQCTDEQGHKRWWFSGSGIHPLFRDLGLEHAAFHTAVTILYQEGVSCIRAGIPDHSRELRDFCGNAGFIEDDPHSAGADQAAYPDRERILMKYTIRKDS